LLFIHNSFYYKITLKLNFIKFKIKMLITKDEIEKLIDEKLNDDEKEFYKKYLEYSLIRLNFDIIYFLKNKNLFFRYMK
jgi:hypothetical protein